MCEEGGGAKVGDVIEMSESAIVVTEKFRWRIENLFLLQERLAERMRQFHDAMFEALWEIHPELRAMDCLIDHVEGKIVVMSRK